MYSYTQVIPLDEFVGRWDNKQVQFIFALQTLS
jgi:hypothetical protein